MLLGTNVATYGISGVDKGTHVYEGSTHRARAEMDLKEQKMEFLRGRKVNFLPEASQEWRT